MWARGKEKGISTSELYLVNIFLVNICSITWSIWPEVVEIGAFIIVQFLAFLLFHPIASLWSLFEPVHPGRTQVWWRLPTLGHPAPFWTSAPASPSSCTTPTWRIFVQCRPWGVLVKHLHSHQPGPMAPGKVGKGVGGVPLIAVSQPPLRQELFRVRKVFGAVGHAVTHTHNNWTLGDFIPAYHCVGLRIPLHVVLNQI